MVLIPVYEDPDDAKSSPFTLSNVQPFTWQWLSTINRVNSQVQKVCLGYFLRLVAMGLISSARHLSFRM
jgi:tRNA-splicing endonuclease subunit Sen2